MYPHLVRAKSHEDLHHNCDEYIELRERDKGKGTAYGFQCQFCGEFRGGEVSKKNVQSVPSRYDPELEEAFYQKIRQINNVLYPKTNSTIVDYKPVDHSAALEKLINKYCDENGVERSSVFRSFLIGQRENYIRDEFTSNWQSEKQLHSWFKKNLSEYFEIFHEVKGSGFVNRTKRNLRIDFVIKAKTKLIKHGFTDQYIGVEVKYLSPKEGKGFAGKSSYGVFQALSYWYSGARWWLPEIGEIELASVLMFSNLSFQDESISIYNTLDSHYRKVWNSYLSIANHANVGELLVRTHEGELSYWSMSYNGSKYYSMFAPGDFKKGNPNVINKHRIGNAKS